MREVHSFKYTGIRYKSDVQEIQMHRSASIMHGWKWPCMEKLARMIEPVTWPSHTRCRSLLYSQPFPDQRVCVHPVRSISEVGFWVGHEKFSQTFRPSPYILQLVKKCELLWIFDPSYLWFARSFGGLGPGRLEGRDYAILWFLRCRSGPRILFKHDYH